MSSIITEVPVPHGDVNMATLMFVDVETTGLPQTKYGKIADPAEISSYDGARMVELAYVLYSEDGRLIGQKTTMVIPDGFEITNSFIHGITTDQAQEEGCDLGQVLDQFRVDLEGVVELISHNVEFDFSILLSEAYRANRLDLVDCMNKKTLQCTMWMGRELTGQGRNPRLISLYNYLFEKNDLQEHRAMSDVKLCAECYWEMKYQEKLREKA